LVITLTAIALSGCASDETAGRFLVSPDKYQFYDCGALAREARSYASRQREIEALMIKAESDAGGRFVSTQVYRPEYLQLVGMMGQIRKTAAEKNCNLSGGGSGVDGRQGEQTAQQPLPRTELPDPLSPGGHQ
jgi:hypothetical protein